MSFLVSKDVISYKKNGEVSAYTVEGDSITFDCERGVLRVQILTANCVRITYSSKKRFLDIPSFAVISEAIEENIQIEQNEEAFLIKTIELNIRVLKADGRIIVTDKNNHVVSEDVEGFNWNKQFVQCKKKLKQNLHFYGLGEKTGFLDKRGRKYMMWNTDETVHTPLKDPLYKSIPFLITFDGKCASGIFVDKTCKVSFDLGAESSEYFSFDALDDEMDYYFIHGPEIKRVVSTYTEITGRMYMPPMWALGYQQCRWSYFPEENVVRLADAFRSKDIPCDVIYLDIDYMDEYRVFTWNKNRFPDPEKMLAELKEKGFKVVTIVDPGVKQDPEYDVYIEGVKRGLFCKMLTGEVYHGKVWPGVSAYPDFTNEETRQWWGGNHRELLGKGISGIWNDMNEPSNFAIDTNERTEMTVPDDVIMENDGHPRTFAKYHNSYGLNMCKGTYEGFKEICPEQRPFIVTRSAYAGIQRYSCVWTGDNHSWWEHMATAMPMHMNIGMSGVPFVGADVGGFQENASPELFARWMQLAAFTPLFRSHSNIHTKPHEPWAFGNEVEEICKKYIKIRYSLLPYHYNTFYQASITGLPIMRPLVLEYPEDENVHNLSDQFLYGESILVAPVYRPSTNKRIVYLPEGDWYNFWTDEKSKGKSYIVADAPLDTLPIFIKAGAIIPSETPMNYVGEKPAEVLTLDIYYGKDTLYSFYEDDGKSNQYKEGVYAVTNFKISSEKEKYTFKIEPIHRGYKPARRTYHLKVHGESQPLTLVQCEDLVSSSNEEGVLSIIIRDTGKTQTIHFILL